MTGLKIANSVDSIKREQIEIGRDRINLCDGIRELVSRVKIISKEQIWEYYQEYGQAEVSISIKQLLGKRALYQIEDGPLSSIKNKYIADPRLIDPDFFSVRKHAGKEDAYGNLECYRAQIESLFQHYCSFWVFLDFKKKAGASDPFSIDSPDYPFMMFGFFMDNDIWEILYVKQGTEGSLMMLVTKEKYAPADSGANRIVIVEDESQIEIIRKYHVSGIKCFVKTQEDGNTAYIA